MAAFYIRYKQWVSLPDLDAEGPFFDIYPTEGTRRIRSINVLIEGIHISDLKHEMLIHESEQDTQLQHVVIRYAIRSIEQGLREDIFPNPPNGETDILFIPDDDLRMLRKMLQEKTCSYQIKEDRELLCSAASETDKTFWL
jgi:hypothetical protein